VGIRTPCGGGGAKAGRKVGGIGGGQKGGGGEEGGIGKGGGRPESESETVIPDLDGAVAAFICWTCNGFASAATLKVKWVCF